MLRRSRVILTCGFVALLCARPALAGDFVDTRLNFTLTDENVLVKPGETNPSHRHTGQQRQRLGAVQLDHPRHGGDTRLIRHGTIPQLLAC